MQNQLLNLEHINISCSRKVVLAIVKVELFCTFKVALVNDKANAAGMVKLELIVVPLPAFTVTLPPLIAQAAVKTGEKTVAVLL